ncbi:hypothetical protein DH86_00004359 [Scytalidium sp. 3C]|nr:hypothetical protein DH86_00004359 [Scytalidium sp. 3C]
MDIFDFRLLLLSVSLISNTPAFYLRDPIDLALDWALSEPRPIPVIMPADEKRPGGDWEIGPRFRNPPEEVAIMWQEAFLRDSEFVGLFGDIVFAFDSPEGRNAGASPRGSTAKNIGRGGKKQSTAANDLEVFKHIFKPAVIYDAFKS